MHTRSKLLLGALTAALVLGAAVGSASARRIQLSDQTFRAIWNPLVFSNAAESIEVRCAVTLEGSFHSKTLSKVNEQLVGYVTSAKVAEAGCAGGRARALTETLPWHIRYESFAGTLPIITSISVRLVGASFLVEVFGVSCLYATEAGHPARGQIRINGSNVATELTALETPAIPKHAGSFLCPPEGVFRGTTTSLTSQSGGSITVTLVQ